MIYYAYLVIADSMAASRYVQVDPDVWNFLKYVGVLFVGLLGYGLLQLVGIVKDLVKTLKGVNETLIANGMDITDIKKDVSDINSKLEKHDERILDLERRKN